MSDGLGVVAQRRMIAVLLVAGLMLPFASLPPFALGYWDKAEPLVVGLYLCSALAAFALAIQAARQPQWLWSCCRHPTVLIPLVIGVLGCLVAPHSELPVLSILGAPQSGSGALWSLEFWILIVLGRHVSARPQMVRGAASVAVAATVGLAILKAWDWYGEATGLPNLLIWVSAYYAWCVPAMVLMVADPACRMTRTTRLIACMAALCLVIVSRSATAFVMIAVGGACWALFRRAMGRGGSEGGLRLSASGIAVGALVAPLLLELYCPAVRQIASIDDRYRLVLMVTKAVGAGDWQTGLFGFGWGRVEDAYQKFLNASGMRIWDGQWIFLRSDYFHAHNGVLEALHGAGAVGALLTAAFFASIPLCVRRDRLPLAAAYAIAYGGLTGLWFPLALSLPAMALSLGILIGPVVVSPVSRRLPGLGGALVLVGVGFLAAAGLEIHAGLSQDGGRSALLRGQDLERICFSSPRGDDLALAAMFRDALVSYETVGSEDQRRPAMDAIAAIHACLVRKIPLSPTPLLAVTGLSLMAQVHLTESLGWAAAVVSDERWEEWLNRALALAPDRSDLAIPFLTHQAVGGHGDVVRRIVGDLLSHAPDDAVGLYFLGLVQVQSGNTALGLDRLRESVDHGIERFMPLDPQIRAILYPGRP